MINRHSTKPARSTRGLTDQVLIYLREHGFTAWENKTVGVFNTNTAAIAVASKVEWLIRAGKSVPNLIGMIQGILKKHYIKPRVKGDPVRLIKAGIIQRGMADIEAVHQGTGIFFAIEIKHGKDNMSPVQIAYKEQILKTGAGYIEVKVLSDLITYINSFKPLQTYYENVSQDCYPDQGGDR